MKIKKLSLLLASGATPLLVMVSPSCSKNTNQDNEKDINKLLNDVKLEVKDKANILASSIALQNAQDKIQATAVPTGYSIVYKEIKASNTSLTISFIIKKGDKTSTVKTITIDGFKSPHIFTVEKLNEFVNALTAEDIYIKDMNTLLPSAITDENIAVSYRGQFRGIDKKVKFIIVKKEADDKAGSLKLTLRLKEVVNVEGVTALESSTSKEITITGFKANNDAQTILESLELVIDDIASKEITSIKKEDIKPKTPLKEGYSLVVEKLVPQGDKLLVTVYVKNDTEGFKSAEKVYEFSGFKEAEGKKYVNKTIYDLSKKGTLFSLEPSANKEELKKLLDKAINDAKGILRVYKGVVSFKIKSQTTKIEGITVNSTVKDNVNTHGSGLNATIGLAEPSGNSKGINITKVNDNLYEISWVVMVAGSKTSERDDEVFKYTINLA